MGEPNWQARPLRLNAAGFNIFKFLLALGLMAGFGLVGATTASGAAAVSISSVTMSAQGGTAATYGTVDNAITYTMTVNYVAGGGGGNITPSIGTLPSGVSAAFSPTSRSVGNG